MLRQKACQAGAVLEDNITEQTSLVIAAKNTSATEAASHLTQLPSGLPLRSKKYEGHKLKLPANISFVVPQYISDCLAQDQIVPTSSYLITLQQVAIQDTRSYSEESHSRVGNDSPQHSTAAEDQHADHHPTTPADATPINSQGMQAPSIDAAPTSSNKRQKVTGEAHMDPHEHAAAGSSKGPPDKKIGIYPDVDPKEQKFTGGNTGIVWGTGTHHSGFACVVSVPHCTDRHVCDGEASDPLAGCDCQFQLHAGIVRRHGLHSCHTYMGSLVFTPNKHCLACHSFKSQ